MGINQELWRDTILPELEALGPPLEGSLPPCTNNRKLIL